MLPDKAMVKEKLLAWDQNLQDFSLPSWEDFPELPLYMDQVIYLMNQYLTLLPEDSGEPLVTPAMINNYVKMKIVPAPVKKRYSRTHLAYLVMVCVMKQTQSTASIKKLLAPEPSPEEARALYTEFALTFRDTKAYFRQEVRRAAAGLFSAEDTSVNRLIFQASTAANLSKLLTERLILLYPGGEKEEK